MYIFLFFFGVYGADVDDFAQQILGAADPEVQTAQLFEEILHRLPQVKTLRVSRPAFVSTELN